MQTPTNKNRHFVRRTLLVTLCILLVVAFLAFIKSHNLHIFGPNKTEKQLQSLQQKFETLNQDMQKAVQNKDVSANPGLNIQVKDAYLLARMAASCLQTHHDVGLAKQLLQLAAEQLNGLSGPKIEQAKRSISNDQQKLDAATFPDMQKLQIKLNTLDKLIGIMPAFGTYNDQITKVSKPPVSVVQSKTSWWQKFCATFSGFKDVVKIRKRSSIPANITDIEVARAQFKLIIEQLRWAIYYQNGDVYQRSIQNAQELLPHIFDMRSESAQKFAAILKEMQNIKIQINLPSVQDSVNALQAILIG